MRPRDAALARGRCLDLSLIMLVAARAVGAEAELVVWRVRNDRRFNDHWAVAISSDQVIDLTRSQVDGRTGLVHHVDDYPANFTRPRRYGAASMTSVVGMPRVGRPGRLSFGFLWKLRWHMFLHDLALARDAGQFGPASVALGSLLRFGWVGGTREMRERMKARRAALDERLGGRNNERPCTIRRYS